MNLASSCKANDMPLTLIFWLMRSTFVMRMLNRRPRTWLIKRVAAQPGLGIVMVLSELTKTNSRSYAAELAGALAALPEATLSNERAFSVLFRNVPVESKSIRELLRIIEECMKV
jgi:hypothetical protein